LTNGNVNFKSNPDSSILNWTYTQNGVDVSLKCVELDFRNGTLSNFYDGWNIYSVGSTSYMPEDQAISLALPVAENFTLVFAQPSNGTGTNGPVTGNSDTAIDVMPDLTNATTQAQFSMQIRNTSSIALYPLWIITFKFYKPVYDIIGITVGVWGDTGQIENCQAEGINGPPSSTQPNPTTTPTGTAAQTNIDLSIAIIGTVVLLFVAALGITLKMRRK